MIIYQLTTFFPLCGSKSYIETIEEGKKILAAVVEQTEKYRKYQDPEEREKHGIRTLDVKRNEMVESSRLIRIDTEMLNADYLKIFGPEKPITNPVKPTNE